MSENRKRNASAWDQQLTEEQQAQVFDRMRMFPWYQVAPWVTEAFHIPAPSRAALYRFGEWFREHETEIRIRQRLKDAQELERELDRAGAPDPEKLARAFGNDVLAARAKGDDGAIARAVRAYKTVASIVGDTRTFDLKVREFEQAQRDFGLKQQDMEIKLRRLELIERKLAEATAEGATVDPKALADEVDRILGRRKTEGRKDA